MYHGEASFCISSECCISKESLDILIPPLSQTETFGIMIKGEKELHIQRRKHRSKRINKKWLKRYGCDISYLPIETYFPRCRMIGENEFEVLAEK